MCWMLVTFCWTVCHLHLQSRYDAIGERDNGDSSYYTVEIGNGFIVAIVAMLLSLVLFAAKVRVHCRGDEGGGAAYKAQANEDASVV